MDAFLKEIADDLVKGRREGRMKEGLRRLYAPDAVFIEAFPEGGVSRKALGLAAIEARLLWLEAHFETEEAAVDGPFLHWPDRFAVNFAFRRRSDQGAQERATRSVAFYTVSDHRIVREELYSTNH